MANYVTDGAWRDDIRNGRARFVYWRETGWDLRSTTYGKRRDRPGPDRTVTVPTTLISKIPSQQWLRNPSTLAVMQALTRGGAEVRFVGGCVRDALLGRQGVDNIDIATSTAPNQVITLLEDAGLKAIPTGLQHGTVTAVAANETFEITTLRRDINTDGRHATVAFTTDWSTDANRRDFTINAMYCDLDGTLYDPLGGADDLRSGKIRFVGNANRRIEEDVLRILRFFRFYAHFGKDRPDAEALAACGAAVEKLDTLSGHRIRVELLKWLDAPDPIQALKYADDCGVLASTLKFFPNETAIVKVQNLVSVETKMGRADPIRRLAVLASDSKQRTALTNHLKLSNEVQRRLEGMFTSSIKVTPALSDAEAYRALYRLGPERFVDMALMAWARVSSEDNGDWQKLLDLVDNWQRPQLPVSGEDILALGVPAGPLIGKVLNEAEEWWIAGNFEAGHKKTLAQVRTILADHKQ